MAECNGWTNYETWCWNLWATNDGGRCYDEMAQECYDNAEPGRGNLTRKEQAAYDLSELLKNETEDAMPELPGVFADLLGAAISEINFDEIAAHFMDNVEEEVEEIDEVEAD